MLPVTPEPTVRQIPSRYSYDSAILFNQSKNEIQVSARSKTTSSHSVKVKMENNLADIITLETTGLQQSAILYDDIILYHKMSLTTTCTWVRLLVTLDEGRENGL